jgi:hypothetical protein
MQRLIDVTVSHWHATRFTVYEVTMVLEIKQMCYAN